MIKPFADKRTEALFVSDEAGRLPPEIVRRARRKLEYIDLAARLDDLQVPPGNRLHRLLGDRKGRHATNGESASDLLTVMPTTSRLRITTNGG